MSVGPSVGDRVGIALSLGDDVGTGKIGTPVGSFVRRDTVGGTVAGTETGIIIVGDGATGITA